MRKNYPTPKVAGTTLPYPYKVNSKKKTLFPFFYLLLIIGLALPSSVSAQVTITKPNLTINTCSFPSGYRVLPQIEILETAAGNFSANALSRTIILSAPTNFEFNTAATPTIAVRATRDITSASIVVNNATTITITYTCPTTTNNGDRLRINNIEIRAINAASTGDITRTGGTGTINGLINGTTLTNTLTSNLTIPTINTQPTTPAAVCAGSGTRTISVATTGATTFQWRKNGTNLTNTAPYSGVTTATLTITNPALAENGAIFDVIVGNAVPCTVTSTSVTLTVNPSPAAIIGGAASVCVGNTTPAFTNATAGGTWSITSGTGTASITSGGVVTGLTSGTVTVVYTLGTCSTTTGLTVNNPPSVIGGGSTTVCLGSSTPAFTNATVGGTWAITPGTGTASITAGGVVTGLTTGTVTVTYTISSCTPATTSLTVLPIPAAIGGGAPSVCVGNTTPSFTNATAGGTWSITPGTGTASINSSGIVTGVTAGTVTAVYTLGTCSVNTNLTIDSSIASLATTPSPTNAATGVCYSGGGAITDLSWTAAAGAISYNIYFGTNPIPPFVLNQASTSYPLSTLLPNTTYYWRIAPVGPCGVTTGTPITWSFTTANAPCYCTSISNNNGYNDGITNVQFNTINNTTSANAGNEYTNYTATQNTSVIRGIAYNLNVSINTGGNFTQAQMAWIDWNQNGDFNDAGEAYNLGTATNVTNGLSSACPVSITIPLTAPLGTTRMRVSSRYNNYPTPCLTGFEGEVEDYSITLITGPACTTPTNQPTALTLTPGGTFINGSFTAATSTPDHYIVVINTTGVAPTLTNGTTYTVGDNLGGTNIVVDTDNNTTFIAGQLNLSTTYYVYVFSYNTACSGGPSYNNTSPLNGTSTTTASPPTYCTPVTTSVAIDRLYVSNVEFVGTLLDTSNTSTTDGTPDGYQDFTGLTPLSMQAQAGPVNMKLTSNTRGFWKVWVDWNKDGDFNDSGEEVYNPAGWMFITTTFGFVVPANTAPGNYRMRVRVQNSYKTFNPSAGLEGYTDFTPCNNFTAGVNISGNTYATYGEAEDYLFTVIPKCDNTITSITNPAICGTGTATLSATGTGPNIRWYDSLTGGTLLGTTASGANFTTPVISTTTTYYITSQSGTCETLVRTPVVTEVKPVPGLIIGNPSPTICGENAIIQLDATGDNEVAYLINEDFESGGLGVFTNINSDGTTATQKSRTTWKNKSSIFIPTGNRWFPAISSGFGTNKFVLTSMDDFKSLPLPTVPMQNSLTLISSVNPSATAFLNLTLTIKMFYSRYYADGVNPATENCNVEVSTNGGGTWTTLPGGAITADQGYGSNFVTLSYNLNAYVGSNNLKIRIRVLGDGSGTGTAGDGVAIDDVKLFGDRPLTPYFALGGGVDSYTDAAATIPYTGDQRNTIWIKPTLAQLESSSFVINVSANLNNGCTTSAPINVTNNTKVWKGAVNSDWNNASNWAPASVPTASNCVIIPGTTVISGSGYNAYGRNLTVKSTGNLNIASGNNLTITDWVDTNTGGQFTIQDNSSLIQINNVANTGTIQYRRIADLRLQDYCYWSSPVGNGAAGTFPVQNVSSATPSNYVLRWDTTATNANGGQGNWATTNENMIPTKGYALRAPAGFATGATTAHTANFIGVPNNGTYTATIYRGTDFLTPGTQGIPRTLTDDNWNLLGNPYPSAIGVNEFLDANSFAVPTNDIQGFVKIWTHGQLPTNSVDPFYGNYSTNYYPSDYITINKTAASSGAGDYKIGAGQGFMVLMDNGAPGSGTVTFNNSMRSNTFTNTQFYKTNALRSGSIDKSRIWIDLVLPNNSVNRTVVGYVDGATNGKDNAYDAFTDYKPATNFYTLIGNEPMLIQGKQIPFASDDTVQLGFKTSQNGNHTIAIATVDGLFNTQNIYLQDTTLNVTHDLKSSPYTFHSNTGVYNDRFIIKYENALNTSETSSIEDLKIYASNYITIRSDVEKVKNVMVYDITGKTLLNITNLNKNEVILTQLQKTNSVVLVKVVTENNKTIVKKVIF